jgi:hypothetical protein
VLDIRITRALYALLFITLTCVYTFVAMRVPVNSDGASPLLIAKDIAAGNIFLQGWSLSTVSFYFTELLPYALAIKLFGWHMKFAYVIPAMMLATVVTLSLYLSTRHRLANAWPVLVAVACPGFFAANIMLVPSIHMGAYAAGLLTWVFVTHYREQGGWWRLALIYLLMTATLFSDDIAKYFLLLPLCIASGYFLFKERDAKDAHLIGCSMAALISTKLIGYVFTSFNGFVVPGLNDVVFASYDAFWVNLDLVLRGTFVFFDAEFFGHKVLGHDGIVKALRALFAFSLIFAFVRIVRRPLALDFSGFSWALSALVMLSAYTFSNLPIDVTTTRYLVPVFIFGTLLVAYSYKLGAAWWRLLVVVAAVYAVAFMTHMNSRPNMSGQPNAIVQELQKRNLTHGFGTYWNANANAFASGITVAPVWVLDDVYPRRWLSSAQWYLQPGNFMIVDSQQEATVAQTSLGKADEMLPIEGKYLMLWSKPFILKDGTP